MVARDKARGSAGWARMGRPLAMRHAHAMRVVPSSCVCYGLKAKHGAAAAPIRRYESRDEHMNESCLKSVEIGTGLAARTIAVRQRGGASPALFWLGGFKSDMRGTKAEALDQWAAARGR